MKAKVFCVDDNAMVNKAVRVHIESTDDFEFMGASTTADGLLAEAAKPGNCPDIVLMDIDMPGMSPFQALGQLMRHCHDVRVLMHSGLVRRDLIDKAITHGAWGYVAKSDGIEGLLSALRAVISGNLGFSPHVKVTYAE